MLVIKLEWLVGMCVDRILIRAHTVLHHCVSYVTFHLILTTPYEKSYEHLTDNRMDDTQLIGDTART